MKIILEISLSISTCWTIPSHQICTNFYEIISLNINTISSVFSFLESKGWIKIHGAQWTHGATNLIADDLRTEATNELWNKDAPSNFHSDTRSGRTFARTPTRRLLIGQLLVLKKLFSRLSSPPSVLLKTIPKALDFVQSRNVWRKRVRRRLIIYRRNWGQIWINGSEELCVGALKFKLNFEILKVNLQVITR